MRICLLGFLHCRRPSRLNSGQRSGSLSTSQILSVSTCIKIGKSSEPFPSCRDVLSDSLRPVDVQLLGLALSEWGELDVDDHHTIRDLVYERALDCGADLAKHAYDISRGLRRLKNYVRFKRACVLCMFGAMAAIDTTVRLQPQPPAEAASSGDSAGVPFPWLDVKLSHFQHLGWRLRPYPDVENEMIDYNDYADDQDPRARFIVHPRDHFTPWQEGGLLMVSPDQGI